MTLLFLHIRQPLTVNEAKEHVRDEFLIGLCVIQCFSRTYTLRITLFKPW